jgi:ornithine cyclodeaminase/alanine dehydrogenase-like protein (mu-crystallin family)
MLQLGMWLPATTVSARIVQASRSGGDDPIVWTQEGVTVSEIEFLDEAAVAARLEMPALIDAMERALIDFSAGRVLQPVRQMLPVEPHGGVFALMPAVAEAMGVKIVTFYPGNQKLGLHTHQALVLVFDPATGQPQAVMVGRLITEMRTAAVSAAATRLLSAEDASVLAVLGSGVQADAHVAALRCVRDIDEIRIWSRNPEHAEACAARVGGSAMGARSAVDGADIIVTATAAAEPILLGAWLGDGVHVNAIGWNGVDGRELDDDAMGHLVFVESRAAAADQAGNIRGSNAPITAEIGEAFTAPDPMWRSTTTVFDSVGIAIEDVAAAHLVLHSTNR